MSLLFELKISRVIIYEVQAINVIRWITGLLGAKNLALNMQQWLKFIFQLVKLIINWNTVLMLVSDVKCRTTIIFWHLFFKEVVVLRLNLIFCVSSVQEGHILSSWKRYSEISLKVCVQYWLIGLQRLASFHSLICWVCVYILRCLLKNMN